MINIEKRIHSLKLDINFSLGCLVVLLVLAACASEPAPTPAADGEGEVEVPTATPAVSTDASPYPVPALAQPEGYPPPDTTVSLPSYPAPLAEEEIPVYTYRVLNQYHHDTEAFTQGLVWHDGRLLEGTGLVGESSLRRVVLETGEVEQIVPLPAPYFGEGITVWQDLVFQITWQNQQGFKYDVNTFEKLAEFSYSTEGWGLTHDGRLLIMSDGSSTLYFRDPETFAEMGRVQVFAGEEAVVRLNELEYINGEVWANIWQTNRIARIDPGSGQVTGWVDLSGLLEPANLTKPVDVLNGIAYDADNDRLFVTGKLWPTLFEIEVIEER